MFLLEDNSLRMEKLFWIILKIIYYKYFIVEQKFFFLFSLSGLPSV